MGLSGCEIVTFSRFDTIPECHEQTNGRTTNGIVVPISSVVFMPACRTFTSKILCIFVTGGAYAPYAPCLSTPLYIDVPLAYTNTPSFLPARRYASAGNSDRNVSVCLSVCPSVCPSRAGIVSKRRKLAA